MEERNFIDMSLREIFAECGIAPGEADDAVDVLDSQLSIFKRRIEPRRFVDGQNRVVFAAAVRGTGLWLVLARSEKGLDTIGLAPEPSLAQAQASLDAHAKKKRWIAVPGPEALHKVLSAVMDNPPGIDALAACSELRRATLARWADAVASIGDAGE